MISVVKKIITPSARQQNANEHHANHDYTRLDWLCAGACGTRRVHGVACWLYAVAVAVGAQGRRRVALGILSSSSLMTLLFLDGYHTFFRRLHRCAMTHKCINEYHTFRQLVLLFYHIVQVYISRTLYLRGVVILAHLLISSIYTMMSIIIILRKKSSKLLETTYASQPSPTARRTHGSTRFATLRSPDVCARLCKRLSTMDITFTNSKSSTTRTAMVAAIASLPS